MYAPKSKKSNDFTYNLKIFQQMVFTKRKIFYVKSSDFWTLVNTNLNSLPNNLIFNVKSFDGNYQEMLVNSTPGFYLHTFLRAIPKSLPHCWHSLTAESSCQVA